MMLRSLGFPTSRPQLRQSLRPLNNITNTRITPQKYISPLLINRSVSTKNTPLDQVIFKPKSNEIANSRLMIQHLSDNPGSNYQYKRVGRGIGSGKGKTAGRGHKGQNSRSGSRKPHESFEGGQTPLFKRMRKYGFTNGKFKKDYDYVNLSKIQDWVDRGRINPQETITMKTLLDTKCVSRVKHGLKVLGRAGDGVKQPLKLEVSAVTKSAVESIEGAGGSVTTMYYNRLGLKFLLRPHKFEFAPARAAAKEQDRHKFDDWGQYTSPRHLRLMAYKQQQQQEKEVAEGEEQE